MKNFRIVTTVLSVGTVIAGIVSIPIVNSGDSILHIKNDTVEVTPGIAQYAEYETFADTDTDGITAALLDETAVPEPIAETAEVTDVQTAADSEAVTEATASDSVAPNEDSEEQTVWISSGGKKYHSKSTCSNMKKPAEISLDEAELKGYEPCKKCYKQDK